jgi:hypothetical protein
MRQVVVRIKGFPRYWASIAASGPRGYDHVWADQPGAASFASAMDATMVARMARRDGIECEVIPDETMP